MSTEAAAREHGGRASAREQTRAQILAACTTCFSTFGIGRSSIDDIARSAGVSRATIYNYFPGKNELIEGWLAAEQAAILDRVRELVAKAGIPANRSAGHLPILDAGFLFVVDAIREHPVVRRAVDAEREQVAQVIAAGSPAILARARKCFAEVLAPILPPGSLPPALAAEWLIRQALVLVLSPPEGIDLDDADDRRTVARLVTAGLVRDA